MLRWAIVGFGDIAQKGVAPAIKAHPGSELVAICRRDAAKLAAFAKQFEVRKTYTDYAEMLREGGFDAVYVASPVHLHAPQTIGAIESGFHVLVEKPMALNVGQCDCMIEAAERAGLTLGIAFYHRFFLINARVREIVQSGEVGDLIALHGNASSAFDLSPDDPKIWRLDLAQSGGGPLMDVGSHRLDIFHSLAGPAARVAAFSDRRVLTCDVEDTVSLIVRYASGVQASLSCMWSVQSARGDYEVWCTGGHLVVPAIRGEELIVERDGEAETIRLSGPGVFDLPLIADFVDAVEKGSPQVLPGSAGLEVQRIIDAAYKSSATAQVVELSDRGTA